MKKLHDGICYFFCYLFVPVHYVRSAVKIGWVAAEAAASKVAQ